MYLGYQTEEKIGLHLINWFNFHNQNLQKPVLKSLNEGGGRHLGSDIKGV